ncbi:Heavy metal-associated domain, HMA [Dillenia turbinata]|uniref:Heavy metal-associated domain, HMA n=1 Tax=Dillenia turbinata TaxID=194707 RepID=A0AAN8Z0E1_9MAGN
MEKGEKKEQVDEVVTALYKVDLNCPQCIRAVRKPLLSTQGVHAVDVDADKGELKVKGRIDPKEIHAQIEKLSKKNVVMVSPATKNKGDVANEKVEKETAAKSEEIVIKETKEHVNNSSLLCCLKPTLRVTTIKVHMHCESCANELRKRLLKHKAIYSVKTDMKAETLTVEGPIEPDKLVAYIKNKVHKHAEIIPPKQEKDDKKDEKKDEKKEKVTIEIIKEKEKKEEIKEELKEEEIKKETKEANVPYIIHYVYAPQLFSDENPNACSIL